MFTQHHSKVPATDLMLLKVNNLLLFWGNFELKENSIVHFNLTHSHHLTQKWKRSVTN